MRSAFITGGTGSIGQALVTRFARSGYRVTFQYFSGVSAANELRDATGAAAISCNLATAENIAALDLGTTDVLVNNAGINISRVATADVEIADWAQTVAVNLTAPFLLCRMALGGMALRRWGRIINISSIYGLQGTEGNLPYTVSKHGLSGLTKTVAREYGDRGVTANEVCPGPVRSEMLRRVAEHYVGKGEAADVEAFERSLCDGIPARRLATPEDVAATALFLASDDAAYINGVSVRVDGGILA